MHLWAGLAGGAETILIPEENYDMNDIADRLKRDMNAGKNIVSSLLLKAFASGLNLARTIKEATNFDTRVSVLRSYATGGSPTAADRVLSKSIRSKSS